SLNPLPETKIFLGNKSYILNAVLGLTCDEPTLSKINLALTEGRWFIREEKLAVILPKSVAEALSAKIADEVSLFGLKFRIIGIIDDSLLTVITDLDQKPIFPRYITQTQGGIKTTIIQPQRFVIVPYETALNELDGRIYTISVKMDNKEMMLEGARRIMLGSWGLYEITIGYEGVLVVYHVGSAFVISGLTSLTVPFILTSLVIFITVLGSIQERAREISIYAAVGLSPLHVVAMFTAETLIYAIIGGVLGYVCGISAIDISRNMSLIPSAVNLNMSSSVVFLSVGISFLSTILAAIYPAIKAGRTVTPSLERKWKIRTKPMGDEWFIPLPFTTTSIEEARGIMAFMNEFLNIHLSSEVGVFWVREKAKIREETDEKKGIKRIILSAPISLPPWDSGFIEESQIIAEKTGEKTFTFNIYLKYVSGERYPWEGSNPDFVDAIRKQLLLWKGLTQKERDEYIRKGAEYEASL
ncbi:MAG: FtsX-like permease family protein, partial [Thermoproteota archaeon]